MGDEVGPPLCIREGPEDHEGRPNVCNPPTRVVLPLSAVDPKVGPCLCPLLVPANSPPPNDKPFVGAPEGPLSAPAGSLSLGRSSLPKRVGAQSGLGPAFQTFLPRPVPRPSSR